MKKKIKNYTLTKIAVVIGIINFVVSVGIAFIGSTIYSCIKSAGLVTQKNWIFVWIVIFVCLYIILGGIISFAAVHIPLKKMLRLLDAMGRISEGDFSVRLEKKKCILKIIPKSAEMFNNMAQQLESTEMLSHDFINNFSHEFKTPIASINGFAKLLKSDELTTEEKNEYLDIIIQESERLSNLSNNILTLSKLEKQSILTNQTKFNLTEQIRQVVSALYAKWSKKNVEIDFFSEKDYILYGNRELLSHAWINLLDNAIKFSPENETIQININKEKADEKDKIVVTFSNKGHSESEESLDRFFDKFYQGEKSHSTDGNGLGLPMVKRIVELHDGTITAVGTENEKITFVISLPI